MDSNLPPRHARPFASICVLAIGLSCLGALSSCATEVEPTTYRTTLNDLLLQNARQCDSGFEYPQSLVDGIGTQLVEELRCMDDTILEFYTSCRDPGCIYASGPQPLAMRPEVIEALQAMALASDEEVSISAGYRDVAMQYYSRWYKENCSESFPAAIPGESNHQGGRAIDVRSYDYWNDDLLANGFEHPIPDDRPHYEFIGTAAFRAESAELQQLSIEAYQRLWNRNNPDDTIAEDGIYDSATKTRLGLAPVEGFPMGACAPGSGGEDTGVEPPDVGNDAPDIGNDVPDVTRPDTGTPDTGAPDSTPSDTGAPDTIAPDTSGPDTTTPDTTADGATSLPPLPAYSVRVSDAANGRGCVVGPSAPLSWLWILAPLMVLPRRRRAQRRHEA